MSIDCPECGKTCKNENGLETHKTMSHDSDFTHQWEKREFPEEVKEKISETMKGVPKSEEHREAISDYWSGREKPWLQGENHYKWSEVDRAGYPTEFYGKREDVRERDFRQCRLCREEESNLSRKLDIHHRDGDKMNNKMTNLISLCQSCHQKVENRGVKI